MRRLLVAGFALVLWTSPAAAAPYDFNRDGRQDLVAPMPGWSPGGAPNAGAVVVLPGHRRGPARRPLLLMESARGLPGVPEGDDALGLWTASGDFNGDGFADLALAAPGDGETLVIPGSRAGLVRSRAAVLPLAGPLAAGDLNRDGRADLAVGKLSPFVDDVGTVRLVFGSTTGLDPARSRTLAPPKRNALEFGSVLAIGDVNGDRHPDLVEAAQGFPSDTDGEGIPGHVSYCPGTATGPIGCRALGRRLEGGPTTLALADLDGDGRLEVIAGIPVNHYVTEPPRDDPPGAVRIWRGTAAGPATRSTVLTQNSRGVPGSNQRDDAFGLAVAAADLNGDGRADLAIGAPGEDRGRGRVTVLRGSRRGLAPRGAFTLEQGISPVRGRRRRGDGFGAALSTLDANGDRRADLMVGAPGDRSVSVLLARSGGSLRLAMTATLRRLGLRLPPEPPDVAAGFGALLAP